MKLSTKTALLTILIPALAVSFQNCGSGFQFSSRLKDSTSAAGMAGMDMSEMDMSEMSVAPDQKRVKLMLQSQASQKAGSLTLNFDLMDSLTNKMIADTGLKSESEALIHFFIFDEALKEFRHVHPEYIPSAGGTDGMWMVKADVPVNGNYIIGAQGSLAADKTDFIGLGRITVTGGKTANGTPTVLSDLRSFNVGNSRITMSDDMIMAGKEAALKVTFSRTDGSKPVITNYLGSKAHFTIVPVGAAALVHGHPMEVSDTELMLHGVFPTPGTYRVWTEFIDGGVLKRADLAITVMN